MVINTRIDTIETKTCRVSFLSDDILLFHYKHGILIELEDIKESYNVYKSLVRNTPVKVVLDFSAFSTITSEAREFGAASKLPAIAEAIVIHTLPHRILARFYIMLRKKKHPIKIFMNRGKAIEWLQAL